MMTLRSAEVGASIERINDPVAYADAQWDLDIFAGCFGDSRIMVGDGDGWVEHHGSILAFEFKRPGAQIVFAQDALFRAFAHRPGLFLLAVWGHRHQPERYCRWSRSGPGVVIPCDLDVLRGVVRSWYEYAHALPKPEYLRF